MDPTNTGPDLGVVLSECLLLTMRAQLLWSYQSDLVLKNALFWHLAFWEWIGSAAVFLFLLSSALFLPEQTSGCVVADKQRKRSMSIAGKS